MTELLTERVAKAIAEVTGDDGTHELFIKEAQAAIAAMKDASARKDEGFKMDAAKAKSVLSETHPSPDTLNQQPLPCPFCGTTPHVKDCTGHRSPPWSVRCDHCHAEQWPQGNRDNAVMLWNQRIVPSEIPSQTLKDGGFTFQRDTSIVDSILTKDENGDFSGPLFEEIKSYLQQREIRLLSDEDALKILVTAYCKDQFDNQHDNYGCCTESMKAALEAIKPYLKRETVSLKKCALAYCHADEGFDMNTFHGKEPHLRGIKMAEAILKAAGVQYNNDIEAQEPKP